MSENKPGIFRKQALEALSTSDQLDELIKVTSFQSWIVLLTISAMLIVVILWSIFGSIPTRVQGLGILLSEEGSIFNAVAPEGSGRVVSITVNRGDGIEKNQIIAHLERPDLGEKLKITQGYLEKLQGQYQSLLIESNSQIAQREKHIAEQNEILKRTIASETENLLHVEELLAAFKSIQKDGIATRQEVIQVEQNFYDTKSAIENAQNQLTTNKIAQADFQSQWQERLRDLELKLDEEQESLALLQSEHRLSRVVRSPVTGIVTGIDSTVGEHVTGGTPIISIANTSEGLDAIVYIPPDKGKHTKSNMAALVSPSTIKKEEFGSIVGKVLTVSQYPSTKTSMMAVLQNEDLVEQFLQDSAPIAVRVRLQSDQDSYSGYQWSSSKGPEQAITPGTLINAEITVRKQAPVTLIIPSLKKLIGGA